jgi:hypothetical protein
VPACRAQQTGAAAGRERLKQAAIDGHGERAACRPATATSLCAARVRRRLDRTQPVGVHAVHALHGRRRRRGRLITGVRGEREPHHQAQGLPLVPVPRPQLHRGALPLSVPGPAARPAAGAGAVRAPAGRHGRAGAAVEGRRCRGVQHGALVEPAKAAATVSDVYYIIFAHLHGRDFHLVFHACVL